MKIKIMPRIITTYIFKEMLGPFLLTIGILTVTVLLGKVVNLVELMLTHGIGLKDVLTFIVSMIPAFMVYTLPGAFLVSVLIATARMSSDSEIIAMKASGIGLASIVRPVIVLAVITVALTMAVTLYMKPWGKNTLKELLFNVATKSAAATLTEKQFYDRFDGTTLYVDQVKPEVENSLKRIFISNEADGKDPVIIFAKEGGFAPSSGAEGRSIGIQLEDGAIHQRSSKDNSYHKVAFSTYRFRLDLEGAGSNNTANKRKRGMRELYPSEYITRLNELKASGRTVYSYEIDWQKKFSQPFSVFVFALLALPLGMQKVRSARMTGFGLSIGVILVYYLIDNTLEALGDNGYIHHITAAWGANVILGVLGIYIFYMAAKERPVIRVSAIEDLAKYILHKLKRLIGKR